MSELDAAASGQVSASAAEVYEEFFVPALFGQWPDRILEIAGLSEGDDVLDVGCGTGILAQAAARQLEGSGSVTGIDINDDMLRVARRSAEPVAWHLGPAEGLPFPDDSFDRVVSQFAVMFFADRAAGMREMARVTRPGGTVAVATWVRAEDSPGYHTMIELLQRLFGDDAATALAAPFTLGTTEALGALVEPVLSNAVLTRLDGTARFESIEAWMHTDVRGWTLADLIDDEGYKRLLTAATTELADFVDDQGRVSFAAPALIASASIVK